MNSDHRALAKQRTLTALLFLSCLLTSGAETTFVVRPLSLKDCIQIALEHNLDVKIERFTPEIARYDLNLAYAYYEPVFGGSEFIALVSSTPEQIRPIVSESRRE